MVQCCVASIGATMVSGRGQRLNHGGQSALNPQLPASASGFDSYVADAADNAISRFASLFDRNDFDGIGGIMRPKDEMAVGYLDVLDATAMVFADGIHVLFASTVGGQGVVV